MKTDKEGKWQRDDYDGPGEGGKKPATNSNADVVVVSYEKGGRKKKKKRVVGFLFVSSSGLFFSLFEFMANENQANHTVKGWHCVFKWILCGPFKNTTKCINIKEGFCI